MLNAGGVLYFLATDGFLTGLTQSTEKTFPVKIGPDLTFNGHYDAFVAALKPAADPFALTVQDNLVYAGYIGGRGDDAGVIGGSRTQGTITGGHIAIGSDGSAYVSGITGSGSTNVSRRRWLRRRRGLRSDLQRRHRRLRRESTSRGSSARLCDVPGRRGRRSGIRHGSGRRRRGVPHGQHQLRRAYVPGPGWSRSHIQR